MTLLAHRERMLNPFGVRREQLALVKFRRMHTSCRFSTTPSYPMVASDDRILAGARGVDSISGCRTGGGGGGGRSIEDGVTSKKK